MSHIGDVCDIVPDLNVTQVGTRVIKQLQRDFSFEFDSSQVVKLLNLYTGEPEDRVSPEFVRAVQQELLKHRGTQDGTPVGVLMQKVDEVTLSLADSYIPSHVSLLFYILIHFDNTACLQVTLESIELPAGLQLHFLKKL